MSKPIIDQALAALQAAECAVEQLCFDQDPANQCWVTLAEIRAAIAAIHAEQVSA